MHEELLRWLLRLLRELRRYMCIRRRVGGVHVWVSLLGWGGHLLGLWHLRRLWLRFG